MRPRRAGFKSIHFVLRGAEFEELQGLTRADLVSTYAPFVGRDVPIATVCEIRDRAATILRDAGYIAAVQVPEQRIEKGVVRFQVLIARLIRFACAARPPAPKRFSLPTLNLSPNSRCSTVRG